MYLYPNMYMYLYLYRIRGVFGVYGGNVDITKVAFMKRLSGSNATVKCFPISKRYRYKCRAYSRTDLDIYDSPAEHWANISWSVGPKLMPLCLLPSAAAACGGCGGGGGGGGVAVGVALPWSGISITA